MGRALRITGSVLALTCIGLLVFLQAPNLPVLDLSSSGLWAGLVLALVCYVSSQIVAAEAWRSILSLWGCEIAPGLARGQPMVSQIGKYIPGNVAHLFGRLVIGRRDGVAGGILAASMALEVAITLGVGLSVAGLLVLFIPTALPGMALTYPDLATRLVSVSIAVALVIILGIGVIFLRSHQKKLSVKRPSAPELVRPMVLHLGSFAILGLSLWAVAQAVTPGSASGLLTCTMVFAVAWAVGFVVPGAPGGIGVRDSIIVLGLAASLGDGSGLTVALLHRAVSVLGDVVTFGLGWTMRQTHSGQCPRKEPKPASFAAD